MKLLTVAIAGSILTLITGTAVANEMIARKLISSQGCKGCHIFEKSGATLGPPLDKIGTRLKPAQIRDQLLKPKAKNPKSYMPDFGHLKEAELQALVNFLASRK